MQKIVNKTFDEERALYGSDGVIAESCRFDGPADGESAFKESKNITADSCYFNLRYPFWHDTGVSINGCEMTELCRAALWYSQDVIITNSKLHGIKALRECKNTEIKGCDTVSTEFGWFCSNIKITDSCFTGEYFMMHSKNLRFDSVQLKGKYSFQYIENSVFENCNFDTKDAFWHAKNVTVRNSVIKGEYLGWYCENVTFENCTIIGTQPLCYCKALTLINCQMKNADLAFEKSEVNADIRSSVISIKNPAKGKITVESTDELILDDKDCACEIQILKK